MQAPLHSFRGIRTASAPRNRVLTRNALILRGIHAGAESQTLKFGSLASERRQQLRPLCAVQKNDFSSSSTLSTRSRKHGQGKEASAPLPTGEDDIVLVPCAHLYADVLEKHDIYTLPDFQRVYEKDRSNFRRFLQDDVGVKDDRHLAAMEAFFRAVDSAASRTAERTISSSAAPAAGSVAAAATTAPAAAVGMTCEQVTLSVEGNISAGKSTFLSILNRHLLTDKGFSFVKEPIEQWQNVGGSEINLLDLFYRDPIRMAYTFQNFVFLTRVLQERETYGSTTKARILERSIFSDRMVFVRAVHSSKDLADHELAIYDAWFGPILSSLPTLVPNGLIYLRASPETCMARLRKRARSEEGGIPLAYLKSLHDNHEDWLLNACTLAKDLQLRLQQQQQQQAPGESATANLPTATATTEERNSAEVSTSVPSEVSTSVPSEAVAAADGDGAGAGRRLPCHAVAAGAALRAELRPLCEAPPPALGMVEVPDSLAGCLYIIDATKISGVPSAGFLHQLPSLVVDCETDVDVDGDMRHGESVSNMIRDYTTFVAAYRAACHQLAAQGHTHNASLRLPPPASDYYTTDAAGRVTYRPVMGGVPGSPLGGPGDA